jgi:hypothetical protein
VETRPAGPDAVTGGETCRPVSRPDLAAHGAWKTCRPVLRPDTVGSAMGRAEKRAVAGR